MPKTFRPGMLVNMSILLLKADPPGTPVDINATFVINSFPISTASGQFHAGKNNYRSRFLKLCMLETSLEIIFVSIKYIYTECK